MINRVVLTGRLTKDLELKYTQNGTAVARFTLAVSRQYKNKQTGERETDFISCEVWRQPAENLAKYAGKGSLIGVDGRIQTSHYTDRDGKEVYRTDVRIDSFALLSMRLRSNLIYRHTVGCTPTGRQLMTLSMAKRLTGWKPTSRLT